MTEAEWLDRKFHSQWMVHELQRRGLPRTKAGRRKLRLFACGCCRVVWDVLPDDRLRDAVEVAERFAEGRATKDELAATHAAIESMQGDTGPVGGATPEVWVAIFMAVSATDPRAFSSALLMTATGRPLAGCVATGKAEAYLCDLIRCVFGNPFRPVAVNPAWLTSDAVALAAGIYEHRAFDRLPILADALQDAGCDNDDVLNHCRSEGPHGRGCWVIDLLLGRGNS